MGAEAPRDRHFHFAILKPRSLALFVKLTLLLCANLSTSSSWAVSRSCRFWALDSAIRPRWAFLRFGQFRAAAGRDGAVSLAYGPVFFLAQGLVIASVEPVAGLLEQFLHQARPAETVGLDDEGQFPEQMGTANRVLAVFAGETGFSAVMDQHADEAGDDADRIDRFLPALPEQELPVRDP